MKLKGTFLNNKVAKRIFGLFVISGLIPILLLAFLSLNQISNLNEKQISQQLRRDAKSYGLSLYDRLLVVEHKLKLLVSVARSEQLDTRHFSKQSQISGLLLSRKDQEPLTILGSLETPPAFSNRELEFLRQGNPVVTQIPGSTSGQPTLLMSLAVNQTKPLDGILTAVIDSDYLWSDPATFDLDTGLCVLTEARKPLFCSNPQLEKILRNAGRELELNNKNYFYYAPGNQEILTENWNLFTQPRFFLPSLKIVLLKNRESAFWQMEKFTGIYVGVILLAVSIVALMSVYLIRKSMSPLEALMGGIQRLSNGDFEQRVSVGSGDEFERVADAFNAMATRIGQQLNALSTLAEIDQLILSRPRPEHIVHIFLSGVRNIVECDWAGSVLLTEKEMSGKILFKEDQQDELRLQAGKTVTIPVEERFAIRQKRSFLISGDDTSYSWLTKPLSTANAQYYLVHPVSNTDNLLALLILGFDNKPPTAEVIAQSEEFADRISVAFSNAAWEKKLYIQAHFDTLTGLPNRMLLEDRISQELSHAARNHSFPAILFLDLDRFKNVNDSLGHSAGDTLLKEASTRLRHNLREEDTIARLGGDEFIILVSGMKTLEEAAVTASSVAEKLIADISHPILLGNQSIRISASIGIATYPTDGEDAEMLLRNADSAMYRAKRDGGGSVRFYSQDLNLQATHRLTMEASLHQALQEEHFVLHYQPKLEASSRTITSFEALIRWTPPGKEMIYPNDFIPLSDEIGLSIPIGKWVLQSACAQVSEWQGAFKRLPKVSVNISANHFHNGNLVADVENALQLSGLHPSRLELEITERIAMQDTKRTLSTLEKLCDMGVAITIDDYGVGYSSLRYLTRFPVSFLKIDRSFISDLPHNKKDLAIVSSTIQLAHQLELHIVAEGVETEEQHAILQELECDEVQGFLYSRPVAAGVAAKLIEEQSSDFSKTAS
jgi:diguanylate cyclase (GGDEF)-like protein